MASTAAKAKKAGKGKKTPTARVHRVTHRHEKEMVMMAYIRRLDKIYSDLNMSGTFLRVVQKLRSEYKDRPHELYLKVCKKWGVEPEEEVDGEMLCFGRSPSQKRLFLEKERLQLEKRKEQEQEKEKDKKPVKVESKDEEEDAPKEVSPPKPDVSELQSEPEPEAKIDDREASPKVEYVNVQPGDVVETMVLTEATRERETGFWVPARILSINEQAQNMDVQVLQPLKYNLATKAVAVPYRYVRAPSEITWER